MSKKVTLIKEPINPEEWEEHRNYYMKNIETGKVITWESFVYQLDKLKALSEYIDEIEADVDEPYNKEYY